VIAVIARLTDKGIEYRIEDEYMNIYPEGEEHYKVQPKFSKEPLSFKDLINLIDNAREGGGLIDAAKNYYPEEPEEYYDFATAESAFYPQLRDWYDESNDEWLEEKLELKSQKEQDKKRIKKSPVRVKLMTQEDCNRLNAGGATQIVLNRRVRKWEISPQNL
jgi:hypothetical protein